eukprot:gene7201-9719_t
MRNGPAMRGAPRAPASERTITTASPTGRFAPLASVTLSSAACAEPARPKANQMSAIRDMALTYLIFVNSPAWHNRASRPAAFRKILTLTTSMTTARAAGAADPLASVDALIEGLGEFEESAKGSDAAVIYYAGHGAMIDGVNYLLPKDAVSTNKSSLTGTAVESARLGQAMMGAKLVRLIILDACRNNPTATRSIGGNSRGLTRETGPTSVAVVTLMAAGPGQVAQDGAAGAANSPFAIALTQGLTRPGITVGELPGYVQAEVERMTEGEQTPDLQGIWPNVHWSFDPNGPVKSVAVAGADPSKIKWEKDQVFW